VLENPGGTVLALKLAAPNEWASRRVIEEELTPLVQRSGGAGLGWTRFEGGAPQGGVGKFLLPVSPALRAAVGAQDGDLVLFVAGERRASQVALGSVRTAIVRRLVSDEALIPRFLWIHRFPLFERAADGRFAPCHHLFTMPLESDLGRLETDPGAVHAQLYDLVLNGFELGSGSIRVHRRDIQERIMGVIGMTPEEMELRFGFLLGAFDHGAPPHGGLALGVDRLVMILAKRTSIRETIAFPKTQKASSLMDGAPAPVPGEDLAELHIRLIDNML
jgi:aspartyl-tRNA synthetase